jgi:hypothetical protein
MWYNTTAAGAPATHHNQEQDVPTKRIPTVAASEQAALDLTALRAHFPALALQQDGQPVVFFDNPGGTQVPQACIDAVSRYYGR